MNNRRGKILWFGLAATGLMMIALFQNCGPAGGSHDANSGTVHALQGTTTEDAPADEPVSEDLFIDMTGLQPGSGDVTQLCNVMITTGPSMSVSGVSETSCQQLCVSNANLYPELATTCSLGPNRVASAAQGGPPQCLIDSAGTHTETPNLSMEQCAVACPSGADTTCVYGATVLQSTDEQGNAAAISTCTATLSGTLVGQISLGAVTNSSCSEFCRQLQGAVAASAVNIQCSAPN